MSADTPTDLIKRPDGSYVSLSTLPEKDQLAHELVEKLFPLAVAQQDALKALKHLGVDEMRAWRSMMFTDLKTREDGTEKGFTLNSVCGTKRVRLVIARPEYFGPEADAAKKLFDQFIEQQIKEGMPSETELLLRGYFKVNTDGRLDVASLKKPMTYNFDNPLWHEMIAALEEAKAKHNPTTYLNFYDVDLKTGNEEMIHVNLAKV